MCHILGYYFLFIGLCYCVGLFRGRSLHDSQVRTQFCHTPVLDSTPCLYLLYVIAQNHDEYCNICYVEVRSHNLDRLCRSTTINSTHLHTRAHAHTILFSALLQALGANPSIRLACGHCFHAACVQRMLEVRQWRIRACGLRHELCQLPYTLHPPHHHTHTHTRSLTH